MSEKKKKVIRIVRRRAGDTDQMTGASEQALSSHDVASRPEPPRKARLREDDEQNAPTAAAVPVTEEPTSAEESTKRRVVRRKRISVVTKRSLSESQKQSEPQAAPEPAGDPPEALGGAVRKPMILDAPKPCKVQTPYEELLDSIYDAVLITDADASVIGVNQRAVDSLQYDQDDLLGMPLLTLLPDADIEFLKTLKQMPASKYALIETRCRRRDGSYYPAEIAVKSMGGRGNNIAFFVRNITRRREAEAQLSMVNNAVMNSLTAIVVTDEQGVIRFDNPAAIKIFRAASETRDNQKGLNLADFFIEKEKIESAFKDLRELKTWRGSPPRGREHRYRGFCHTQHTRQEAGRLRVFRDRYNYREGRPAPARDKRAQRSDHRSARRRLPPPLAAGDCALHQRRDSRTVGRPLRRPRDGRAASSESRGGQGPAGEVAHLERHDPLPHREISRAR
jgi:PAS domain S-box-containing protein